MHETVDVAHEVAAALRAQRAVVALESTIVAHGMPWPQNLETARALEAEVRASGATPATIAIIDGRLRVGLDGGELEALARGAAGIAKASRRDIPVLVAQRATGATTVAATMIIAALAGIRVFATGGIGGVHRGAETTFDISADLPELARTPVAMVCAGAKAILDLRLTLEYLETHGVPVIGYRTDRLPAFWTRDSGLAVDSRADDAQSVARIMQAKWQLGLAGGIVVANPIPERFELAQEAVDSAIARAIDEARAQNIAGKALTPYLLARVNALTAGDSLASNIALVRNNARVAAEIATAYAALDG
jgi:pseudouridylate synthase